MWLIAGLGNPGPDYENTRHNIGFIVLEEIARRSGLRFKGDKKASSKSRDLLEHGIARIASGTIQGAEVILIEPMTFMNLSGIAIKKALQQFNIGPGNLIVIHDDIDMDTGRLRIRKRGSSGGHRGVESIISAIGSKEFIRVKIGIGREKGVPVEDYVLSKFREEEIPLIRDAINRAVDATLCIISEGVDKAMNEFNRP